MVTNINPPPPTAVGKGTPSFSGASPALAKKYNNSISQNKLNNNVMNTIKLCQLCPHCSKEDTLEEPYECIVCFWNNELTDVHPMQHMVKEEEEE